MPSAGQHFTREDLVSLKRSDIQKLCKEYGVRANMKTEALIELLLDSLQSNMSPLVGLRRPQQAPAPRRVSTRSSTRVSSLRSRGTSGSSSSTSFVASSSHTVSTSSPRTSKSKLTQYKLGVGRPSAPGAASLRNASRSSSSSRLGRTKSSRSFKPPEATIHEGEVCIWLETRASTDKLLPPSAESETSQPTVAVEQHAGPSTSRAQEWPNAPTIDNNDLTSRLTRLENAFREADVKRQLDSLRDIPSQIAYLKASMQHREAEITGLRGELNVCKAEVLALRGEVSKIPYLEGQLRAMKDTLDYLTAGSSAVTKGKMTRRVSTPLGESDVNSNTNSKGTLLNPYPTENAVPLAKSPGLSETALGKRPRDAGLNNIEGGVEGREGNAMTQGVYTRQNAHPDRKRTRTGTERRPLQEKAIEPKPGSEKATASGHESGEECLGSAGTSASGQSTQPSVTTPPAPHVSEFANELSTHPEELRSDEIDMLDFCQAASSTPRGDPFNFFDDGETFSQLSVTKLGARIAALDNSNPQSISPHQNQIAPEPRRISSQVARPRTPTRPSGHARFRLTVDNVSPIREDVPSPFDPYSDGAFGFQFASGGNAGVNVVRRDTYGQDHNHGFIPAPMPIALGFGLGTAAAGAIPGSSPARPASRTMYGTELQNDTRFGDFGRDGIATSSNMDFWGNF
ncbi:uncharacterized protein FOMMEDRAFT_155294 [Fomitiporia mediterranea MF3/22]|uniref:uncharacterized protein n=1 Tax=Fomitiporia mediterranea (strain MF3/22) TaxID=694068 RepID=UPI000440908E|nr:uncharacterized protein FOMMEDRAFT_155294 [Fomitiporia mediterranea MF3/22]EJD04173.1 hypothetical protein FOMMEDRAFT_155294 [Fomitiporia mediterranea MF3/22]